MDNLDDLNKDELMKKLMLLPGNGAPRWAEIKDKTKDDLLEMLMSPPGNDTPRLSEIKDKTKVEGSVADMTGKVLKRHAIQVHGYNLAELKDKSDEDIRKMIKPPKAEPSKAEPSKPELSEGILEENKEKKNIDIISGEELKTQAVRYYNIMGNLKNKRDEDIRRMIRISTKWVSEEIETLKEDKAKKQINIGKLEAELEQIEDIRLMNIKVKAVDAFKKDIEKIDEDISIYRRMIGAGKKRRRKKQSKRRSKKRRSSKKRSKRCSSKRRSKKY